MTAFRAVVISRLFLPCIVLVVVMLIHVMTFMSMTFSNSCVIVTQLVSHHHAASVNSICKEYCY
ncbi:MAG: hypothetical protein H7Z70_09575 [Bacteroidia bacterium]|nr:hypothetical protein [Methylotenera sp.]